MAEPAANSLAHRNGAANDSLAHRNGATNDSLAQIVGSLSSVAHGRDEIQAGINQPGLLFTKTLARKRIAGSTVDSRDGSSGNGRGSHEGNCGKTGDDNTGRNSDGGSSSGNHVVNGDNGDDRGDNPQRKHGRVDMKK